MGKRELVALLSLSSWCLAIVVWLFLAVPWVCLQFVIVVFPDHTHLLFGIQEHVRDLENNCIIIMCKSYNIMNAYKKKQIFKQVGQYSFI